MAYIPLTECKPRGLYTLISRNLGTGVFNPASNGFIGIREKFDREFLFTEYHWDTGPPYGTVHPVAFLDEYLPDGIELCESLGTVDAITERLVDFDRTPGDNSAGFRGWYFTDTGECDQKIRPYTVNNDALFAWLKAVGD